MYLRLLRMGRVWVVVLGRREAAVVMLVVVVEELMRRGRVWGIGGWPFGRFWRLMLPLCLLAFVVVGFSAGEV